MRKGTLCLTLFLAFLWPSISYSATLHVKPSPAGNDANSGLDWTHAKATVSAAIAAAAFGDEIWVAAGTYTEHIENRTEGIDNTSVDVALYGGFTGTETVLGQRNWLANRTILDGGGGPKPTPPATGSVVIIRGGARQGMRIDGFTITGGHAYFGGGIQVVGSGPTIVNNYIKDNDADAGAGIFIANYNVVPPVAHPLVDNNVIALNYAGDGGGIAVEGTDIIVHLPPVAAIVTNNRIEGNVADFNGGGIGSWGHASLYIANNVIKANAATYDEESIGSGGGGIFATKDDFSGEPVQFAIAAPTIVNNVIEANAARRGAGILLIDYPQAPDPGLTPPPKVINNTIVANNGAGIGWANDFPVIANNVVAFNAWGLQQWNVGSNAPVIRYNNVYGNSVQETDTDYDGISDATGTNGNISADPLLANDRIGDAHVQPGSPCIEAGNGADIGTGWVDMDGQARVQGAGVDIGADESDGTPWSIPTPVYYVSSSGDNTTGLSWATAKKTVQGGIHAAAVTGGEVWVAAGTYAEHIRVPAYVHLYGGFAGNEASRAARDIAAHPAILDGSEVPGVVRIVNAGYRVSALDGFTVQNGGKHTGGTYPFAGTRYGGRGGGIYSKLASPSIANNTIRRNSLGDPFDNANKLGYGAGIFLALNYSRIANNLITENETLNTFDGSGGGIYITLSRPTIEKNTFTRNQARNGSAIYGWVSAPAIVGNLVDNNAFYNSYPLPLYFGATAGAIDLHLGDDFRIEGNTIRRNTAAAGAGIHVVMNYAGEIRNNLIHGNVAADPTVADSGIGGGIYASVSDNAVSRMLIVNNTIAGNTAGYWGGIGALGGGIAINLPWPLPPPNPLPPGKMVIANNVFAYNSSGIFRPPASQLAPTLLKNNFYNGGLDNANVPLGATDIHVDPVFVDNTAGDFRLYPTSLCIDAGNNGSVPTDLTTDFGGNPRILDGRGTGTAVVDIGAYEYLRPLTVGLTASPASPKPAGTSIAFTAQPFGGNGNNEYRFRMLPPGGTWTTVREYAADITWTWNSTGYAPGTYSVVVWARSVGSTAAYDTYKAVGYLLTVAPATSVTLTPSPTSPKPAGTSVLFGAQAYGGSGSYQYKFRMLPPGGTWTTVREYAADNTWTWNSSGHATGAYTIVVWARSVGSSAAYDTYKAVGYLLTVAPATAVTLTPSPTSPKPSGTSIAFTAQASGGSGSYQYKFRMLPPGGTWTTVREYAADNTWTWNSTGYAPGTYSIVVWARSVGSSASYDTYKAVGYVLQ